MTTKTASAERSPFLSRPPREPEPPELAAYRARAADERDEVTPESVAQKLRRVLQQSAPDHEVSFHFDEQNNKLFMRISDARSGQVVREIPSEDLRVFDHQLDELIGVLLDLHA